MAWVNLSEYGRIRGVSSQAVKNAIASGRLVNSVRQKANGKYEVDPVSANLEWDLNTDASKRFNVKNAALKHIPQEEIQPFFKPGVSDRMALPPPSADGVPDTAAKMALLEATRMEKEFKAKLAELEYMKESGFYVEAEKVKADAFKLARGTRDSLMNIPDRVAAEFAGIADAAEIHMRLTNEIRIALETLIAAESELEPA